MALLREDLQTQSGRGQGKLSRGRDFSDDIWIMSGDLPGRPWGVAFQAEGTAGRQERARLVGGHEILGGPVLNSFWPQIQFSPLFPLPGLQGCSWCRRGW